MLAAEKLLSDTHSFVPDVMNVGTGRNYSVNEIAHMISARTSIADFVEHIPERIGEARETLADCRVIDAALDWRPQIELREWIYENRNVGKCA